VDKMIQWKSNLSTFKIMTHSINLHMYIENL